MKTLWEYLPSNETLSSTYNRVISAIYPEDKHLADMQQMNASLRECGDELQELQQGFEQIVEANQVVIEDAEAHLRELEQMLDKEDREKSDQKSNVISFSKKL